MVHQDTTIPKTIPPTKTSHHQDHYKPVKPLFRINTYTVGNCPGGALSGIRKQTYTQLNTTG